MWSILTQKVVEVGAAEPTLVAISSKIQFSGLVYSDFCAGFSGFRKGTRPITRRRANNETYSV